MKNFEEVLSELKTKEGKRRIYYKDLVCYIDSALKGEVVIHKHSNDTKNKHLKLINSLKDAKTSKEINELKNQLILLHRPCVLKKVCNYVRCKDLNISILDAYDYVLVNICEFLKTDSEILEYPSFKYFAGVLNNKVLTYISNYLKSSEIIYLCKERV